MNKISKLASYFEKKLAQVAYDKEFRLDPTFSDFLRRKEEDENFNILDGLKEKVSEEVLSSKKEFEKAYKKLEFFSKVYSGLEKDPLKAIEMLESYSGGYFGDLDSIKEDLNRLKEEFKNKE